MAPARSCTGHADLLWPQLACVTETGQDLSLHLLWFWALTGQSDFAWRLHLDSPSMDRVKPPIQNEPPRIPNPLGV